MPPAEAKKITPPVLQRIEKKDLLVKLKDFFSIPIHEIEEGGRIRYQVGPKKGAMFTKYMVNIKRAIPRCHLLSDDIQRQLAEANNMGVWTSMYLAPSDIFDPKYNVGSDLISVPSQESAAGQAGNTSISFFTPHIPELCKAGLRTEMKIPKDSNKWNYKLLSGSQVNLLRDSTLSLLMTQDESPETYVLDIGSLDGPEVDRQIAELQEKGFRPVRLLFDGIYKELSLLYNVGSINDELEKLMVGQWNKEEKDAMGRITKERSRQTLGEFDRYLEFKNQGDVVVVPKRGQMESQYGIDIKEVVTSKLSNNNFYLVLSPAGKVRGVYVLQKLKAYFLFPERPEEKKPDINEGAFTEQKLICNGNTRITVRPVDGSEPYSVPFNLVSVEDVLEENNWQELAEQKKRTITSRFHFLNFFSSEVKNLFYKRALKRLIDNTLFGSVGVGDKEIQAQVELWANKSEYFKMVQFKREDNPMVNDQRIVFKYHSDVMFENYDRNDKIPYATLKGHVEKENRDLPWIYLRKENTAFEREKVLTLLFLQHRLDYLREIGHTNIRVVLERAVPKYKKGDGNGIGFLDLGLFSTGSDGKRYGQLYEFKAWGSINAEDQKKIDEQADNYNVEEMVSGGHECVDLTYNGHAINRVLGVNLELHTLEALARTEICPEDARKMKL